jgi:hypothetical protein
MLQKFLDPETVACQVFSNRPDPKELLLFVHPSQLEVTYGGKAPRVERFWPPIMPPLTEQTTDEQVKMVPRHMYNAHYLANPELTLMPRCLRLDLDELPFDREPEPETMETTPLALKENAPLELQEDQ